MARSGQYVKDHPDAVKARQRVVDMIDLLDPREIVATIKKRPSLRGILLGYLAELLFETHVLEKIRGISDIRKHDDHDRTLNKADVDFIYRGRRYSIQVKSLQTNSIRYDAAGRRLVAVIQNDGSDKRIVKLAGGLQANTTLYRRGDYDILAVPLFPFTGNYEYAYKRNVDCRACESSLYPEKVRALLLASTEPITYPLSGGWTVRIEDLLDNKIGSAPSDERPASAPRPGKLKRKSSDDEIPEEIWKMLVGEEEEKK